MSDAGHRGPSVGHSVSREPGLEQPWVGDLSWSPKVISPLSVSLIKPQVQGHSVAASTCRALLMAYREEVAGTVHLLPTALIRPLGLGAPEARVSQHSLWGAVALSKHPAEQHCTPQHGKPPIIYHSNLREQQRNHKMVRSSLVKAVRKVTLYVTMENRSDKELVFLTFHQNSWPVKKGGSQSN